MKAGFEGEVCKTPDDASLGYSTPAGTLGIQNGKYNFNVGDTWQYVGWYLGVLATEYRLLKNAGYATTQIEEELYYALKAVESGDASTEKLYYPATQGSPQSCELNGFMTRDIMTESFFDQHIRKHNLIYKNLSISEFSSGIANYYKDFYDKNKRYPDENHSYASVDHLAHLIMGCALVKKAVDADVVYNGTYLRQNAIDIVARIMDYVKLSWTYPIPNTFSSAKNDYEYPLDDEGWKEGGINTFKSLNSYLFAKSGQWMTGNNYDDISTVLSNNSFISKLQFPLAATLGSYNIDHGRAILQSLAAVGNVWNVGFENETPINLVNVPFPLPCLTPPFFVCYEPIQVTVYCYTYKGTPQYLNHALSTIFPNQFVKLNEVLVEALLLASPGADPSLCYISPIPLPSLNINTTGYSLLNNWWSSGQEIYFLLQRYLHGNEGIFELPFMESSSPNFLSQYSTMINAAPCMGPSSYENFPGWRSDNRFVHSSTKDGPPASATQYEANGLDYMLLYNLYKLQFGSAQYAGQSQLTSELRNIQLKTGTYRGFESLTTYENVLVDNSQDVVLESPGDIDITGNFDTQSSSAVDIRLARQYTCQANGSYTATLRQSAEAKKETPDAVEKFKSDVEKYAYMPMDDYLKNRKEDIKAANTIKVKVYPNPVSDKLFVDIHSPTKTICKISLSNVVGHQISFISSRQVAVGTNTVQIDVNHLPSGMYFIHLETENHLETVKVTIL